MCVCVHRCSPSLSVFLSESVSCVWWAGSTDELLSSWKVFTALKDESYDGRRLENAAWRLHAMQKLGKTPSFQAASQVTQGRCAFNKQAPISVQLDDAHLSHTHADLGKAVADSDGPHPMLDDSWAAKHLLGVCLKNKLSNDAIEEVLQAGAMGMAIKTEVENRLRMNQNELSTHLSTSCLPLPPSPSLTLLRVCTHNIYIYTQYINI